MLDVTRLVPAEFGCQQVSWCRHDNGQISISLPETTIFPSARELVENHARHQIHMPAMFPFKITANERVVGQFGHGIAFCHRVRIHAVFRQRIIPPDMGDVPEKPGGTDQNHLGWLSQLFALFLEPGRDLMRVLEFFSWHVGKCTTSHGYGKTTLFPGSTLHQVGEDDHSEKQQ